MAATIRKNIDKETIFFQKKYEKHDHGMNHGKHDNHTMIMLWIMPTMPRNMVAIILWSWPCYESCRPCQETWSPSWYDHDHASPWSLQRSGHGNHVFPNFAKHYDLPAEIKNEVYPSKVLRNIWTLIGNIIDAFRDTSPHVYQKIVRKSRWVKSLWRCLILNKLTC